MTKGRKPTPTGIKRLRGSRINKANAGAEPGYAGSVPGCPEHLTEEAAAEWHRVVSEMKHIPGLLSRVDRGALAAYSQAWARWVEAENGITAGGAVLGDDPAKIRTSPWVGISAKAQRQMLSFASEFGLTPASRTRIHVQAPAKGKDAGFEAALKLKKNA